MPTGNTDMETLASEPTTFTLSSGTEVAVERLKTRATMSLLKILTRGAGDALREIDMNAGESAFVGELLGFIALSIPEAEDETMEFIQRMVSPAKLIRGRNLSKNERAFNEELLADLQEELDDPELDDLVSIIEQIVTNEAPHILALGKRLALLLKVNQKSETAKQSSSSKRSSKASTPAAS